MQQTITDPLAFLAEARMAVEDLSLLKDRENQLEQEEAQLEKTLEAEKKMVADLISQTVKKRQDELAATYDKELAKGQDKLKKARQKREKAKNQGMKDRIAEETAELHAHNKELKLQMKTMFQQNGVPSFCNTELYYSLYFTRGMKEIFRLLIVLILCFLAVPYGIYLLIPEKKPMYLAGIYVADILLFGGLYILISNKTKLFYTEALKRGRMIRDQIRSNHKKIKVIEHSIKKDKNEAVYDLEKYDDEISRLEQNLAETAEKKKEALRTFEHVTKTIISDEIANNHRERLLKLEERLHQLQQQVGQLAGEAKQKNMEITEKYSVYLGRDFLDPLRIGELSEAIRSGVAANLSEAISVCENKGKKS